MKTFEINEIVYLMTAEDNNYEIVEAKVVSDMLVNKLGEKFYKIELNGSVTSEQAYRIFKHTEEGKKDAKELASDFVGILISQLGYAIQEDTYYIETHNDEELDELYDMKEARNLLYSRIEKYQNKLEEVRLVAEKNNNL